MVILSDKSFSKNDTIKIFNCANYGIDLAGKWRVSHQSIGLCTPDKKEFLRHHPDLNNKSEHFLDFTFSSSIPEDDPYSVTKTKNNSGEEQKVVHEVLITKFSHAIAFSIKIVKLLIFHI